MTVTLWPQTLFAAAQATIKGQDRWIRVPTFLPPGFAFAFCLGLEYVHKPSSLAPGLFTLTLPSFITKQTLPQFNYDRPMGLYLLLWGDVSLTLHHLCRCLQQLFHVPKIVELFGLAALAMSVTWAILKWRQGYTVFLSLGRGGTPYNALGYTILSFKSLFGINPLVAPDIPEGLHPQDGFLKVLPQRSSPRPRILGVAPQRQTTQKANWKTVQSAIDTFIKTSPHIKQDTSFLEQHGKAMFPRDRCSARHSERIFGSEIGHVHEYDGSLHLNLHPRDIATVLTSRWGERHPLARGDRLWFAYFRDLWRYLGYEAARPPVSVNWTLIYAPRTEEEQKIVIGIVKAAGEWMTGT
jgi:hypothetical protein